jgi:hypothetical protein
MADLELRMYGLVPYNISPIQQGIQFGHAVQEYNNKIFDLMQEYYGGYLSTEEKQEVWKFEQWRTEDKTFIILNGGTTNNTPSIVTGEYKGSLNNHLQSLKNASVNVATFIEPDLGDQLTAVVFLVDERVFNTKKYPDFAEHILQFPEILTTFEDKSINQIIRHLEEQRPLIYTDWVKSIGGEKNEFLRSFLKNFKLA